MSTVATFGGISTTPVATTTNAVITTTTTTTTGPFNATRNPQQPLCQPTYNFQSVPDRISKQQQQQQSSCDDDAFSNSTIYKITNESRHLFISSMAEMLLLCKEAIRRKRQSFVNCNNNIITKSPTVVRHRRNSPRRCNRTTATTTGSQRTSPLNMTATTTSPTNNTNNIDITTSTTSTNHHNNNYTTGSSKPLSLEYIADRLDIDDPCFGYMIRTNYDSNKNNNIMSNILTTTNQHPPPWGMLQGFITVTTFTNWQKSFKWDSINEAAYYDDNDDDNDDSHHHHTKRVRDVDGTLAQELQSTVHCGDIHMEGIVWPRIAEISLLGAIGCGKTLVQLVIEQLEASIPTIMANYDYVVLQATDNSIPFYESLGFVRVGAIMLDDDIENHTNGTDPTTNSTSNDHTNDDNFDNPFITSSVVTYHVKNSGETFTRIAAKFQVNVWDVLFLNKHILGHTVRPSDKPKLNTLLLIPTTPTSSSSPTTDQDQNTIYVPSSEIQWHIAKENDTPRTIAKMYNVSTYDVVERNKGRLPGLLSSSRLKEGTKIKVSHLHVPDNLYKPYAHWSFPDSKYEDPEPSYMMVRKLHRKKLTQQQQQQLQRIKQKQSNTIDKEIYPYLTSLKAAIVMGDELDCPITNGTVPENPQLPLSTMNTTEQNSHPLNYIPYSDNDPIIKSSLYNKVVRLKSGAMTEGVSSYVYWYVLTYIPDLQWCHLAPMIQDGEFGIDKPRACGKPKWRLVDESLGLEVDISSSYCIPIKSRSMKKTLDADKEEWDIIDDGTDPTNIMQRNTSSSSHSSSRRNSSSSLQGQKIQQRGTIAVKPSVERSRKVVSSSFIMESPSLLATIPGSGTITTVKITGKLLFNNQSDASKNVTSSINIQNTHQVLECFAARKRGRPFGSRNKPKSPDSDMCGSSISAVKPNGSHQSSPEIDIPNTIGTNAGKKRRSSIVQFNVPASARKAAALRTTNAMSVTKPQQDTMTKTQPSSFKQSSISPFINKQTKTVTNVEEKSLVRPRTSKKLDGNTFQGINTTKKRKIDSNATIDEVSSKKSRSKRISTIQPVSISNDDTSSKCSSNDGSSYMLSRSGTTSSSSSFDSSEEQVRSPPSRRSSRLSQSPSIADTTTVEVPSLINKRPSRLKSLPSMSLPLNLVNGNLDPVQRRNIKENTTNQISNDRCMSVAYNRPRRNFVS